MKVTLFGKELTLPSRHAGPYLKSWSVSFDIESGLTLHEELGLTQPDEGRRFCLTVYGLGLSESPCYGATVEEAAAKLERLLKPMIKVLRELGAF